MTRHHNNQPWHERCWGSFALRLVGGLLLLLAWLAGAFLQSRAARHGTTGVIDTGLSLAALLAASIGSAGLIMGGHLIDRVQVSERWRSTCGDRHQERGGPGSISR